MGTTVVAGRDISIRQFDDNGNPTGRPIVTPFVALFGSPRSEVLARGAAQGAAETNSERLFPGSADWLTVIAIADSQEKLQALIDTTTPSVDGEAHTSAASRRVRVEMHIGDKPETLKDAVTIASGEVVQVLPLPILNVETIKVLKSEAALMRDAALQEEFKGAASQLLPP